MIKWFGSNFLNIINHSNIPNLLGNQNISYHNNMNEKKSNVKWNIEINKIMSPDSFNMENNNNNVKDPNMFGDSTNDVSIYEHILANLRLSPISKNYKNGFSSNNFIHNASFKNDSKNYYR